VRRRSRRTHHKNNFRIEHKQKENYRMASINLKQRILLGPGPSNVHPRVLQALSLPLVGYLDPQLVDLMNQIQELLRYLFQTQNSLTIPVSGTGSAGMEAALCNFIEPGDPVLVCVMGYFGERLVEIASRYGAQVTRLDRPWGEAFTPEEVQAALKKTPARLVAMIQAETSTGVRQPMEGMAEIVHAQGGLLVMDCVASLGGVPIKVDEWGVDIAFSGSQKCISVPPGLAPITVNQHAETYLSERKTKVANWYLDLTLLRKFWGKERIYHHTTPVSMIYALYEGLKIIEEEGLEARWSRHQSNAEWLWEGLEKIGLKPIVPIQNRLTSITTVKIPDGYDDMAVRAALLNNYNIEISGGIGAYKGKVWRIGLMGHSSQRENVNLLLAALKEVLDK
jgi:alanine-glyoxylate transaminase / serine-glyoxylate transaminase / serine-pyruvate transaminase